MAAKNYTLNFTDGSTTGAVTLPVGTYTFVSTTIPGYADGGEVTQFTVTPDTTTLQLSIAGDGSLVVSVVDDVGTSITDGTLQFSDAEGTALGPVQDIDNGRVTFSAVPYLADTGISTYLVQNGSDTSHDPITAPQAVNLKVKDATATVENARKTLPINFTMADGTYPGITPITGALVIEG